MQSLTRDEKYNLRIQHALDPEDQLIYEILVEKFNDQQKKQPRILIITSRYCYNVKPLSIVGGIIAKFNPEKRIKRKIEISKIYGVSISRNSNEFVIHVNREYDYRYESKKNRDLIIQSLSTQYQSINKGMMPVHILDDISLKLYTTTKADVQKGIVRIPCNQPEFMNMEQFQDTINNQKIEMIFQDSNELRQSKLNDYIPIRVLGRGSFGKVMLCKQKNTEELFAIKSLRKVDILKDNQVNHIRTERDILCSINHPFLIKAHSAFQTPNKLFFVLPFIGGGELFNLQQKKKRFPEDQAIFYATQMVMALGHLHSLGYAYRDLKPENTLICKDGYLKLADFGLAKQLQQGQRTNTFVGTLDYIAPEICQQLSHDFMVDWWSLGIVIYELVIGRPPFYSLDNDSYQLLEKIIYSEPIFPKNIKVTPNFYDLISNLLRKNPKERLGSKGDVQEILDHPWFKQIDQNQIINKTFQPPYIPTGNDLNNFNKQFTKEPAIFSFVHDNLIENEDDDDCFKGLSYENDLLIKD